MVFCAACSSGSSNGAAPTTSAAPTPHAASSSATTPPRSTTAPASAPATSAGPSLDAPCVNGDEVKYGVHFPVGGDTIEGLTLGTGKVGIVLVPQSGEDLCAWKPYGYALVKQGYRIITITVQTDGAADTVAAAQLLRKRGASRIMLMGASIGGTAVLAAAAALKPPAAAVVDLSGPTITGEVDLIRLHMPVLFVAGAEDEPFARNTKEMFKAAKNSVGRKLVMVPGGAHGIELVSYQTQATIEAFLKKYASG
jgi:pimeloyl-ACP methyl ester carboxylesterase